MFGRTLKISIAKDNGRSQEFDAKRTYPDKQRCYECGQEGHLSYNCPSNVLGNRDPLQKKGNRKNKRATAVNTNPSNPYSHEDTGLEHVIELLCYFFRKFHYFIILHYITLDAQFIKYKYFLLFHRNNQQQTKLMDHNHRRKSDTKRALISVTMKRSSVNE